VVLYSKWGPNKRKKEEEKKEGGKMGRLNLFTCCFRAARVDLTEKNPQDGFNILKNYQTGIYTLLVIQVLIAILWIILSFVNGFALYTVDPSVIQSSGWGHSISHIGFWFVLEFLVCWVGSQVTAFSMEKNQEKSVEGSLRFLIIYFIILGISMVADATHIILTGLEIGSAESTFYVENFAFLVAFLVGYILYLVIIKVWLFYRTVVYYQALQDYTGVKMIFDFVVITKSKDLENGNDSSSPTANASIRTPLLDQLYKKRTTRK